jgi:hypothetical protein
MRLVAETKDDQAPSVHPLYEFLSFSQRLCYKPTRSYQLSMRQYVETLAGDSDDRSQHVAEKPWGVGSTKLHVIHQETREQMRAMTVWHDSRNMRRQRSKWAVKHLVKPCETLWNLVKPCETFNMFNNDEVSNWFKLYEIWRVRHPAHSLLQLPMSHDMATPIFQAMPALPKRPSRKTGWPQLPRSISSACKMSSKCDMNDTAWLMTQRITANHSDAACRKRDTWRFARKTVAESAKFLLGSGAKAPCFAETAMYCNVLQYWSSSIQV